MVKVSYEELLEATGKYISDLNVLLLYHQKLYNEDTFNNSGVNNFDPFFSMVFQHTLLDTMVQLVYKLTDSDDKVLSLPKLVSSSNLEEKVKTTILNDIKEFKKKYLGIEKYRHNFVAHISLKNALSKDEYKFPEFKEIQEASKELIEFFTSIKNKIGGTALVLHTSDVVSSIDNFINNCHKANAYTRLEGMSCIPIDIHKEIINAKNSQEIRDLIPANSRFFSKK